MAKSYVIRKIAYYYSDECFYVHTTGGIQSVIKDKENAQNKYIALETKALKECDLGDMDELSGCGSGYSTDWTPLHNYWKEQFDESPFEEEEGRLMMPMDSYIPIHATVEQVMKIKEMTGISFYELSEFETDEPEFFVIRTQAEDDYIGCGEPYFFNNYEQTLNFIKENLDDVFDRPIKGILEDLSDQPDLLQSLIDQSKGIKYDEKKKILKVNRIEKYADDLVTLNGLLRKPIFEIKPFPLKKAQAIDHYVYEEM